MSATVRFVFKRMVVGTGFTVDKSYDLYMLNGIAYGVDDTGDMFQVNFDSPGEAWRLDEWSIGGVPAYKR